MFRAMFSERKMFRQLFLILFELIFGKCFAFAFNKQKSQMFSMFFRFFFFTPGYRQWIPGSREPRSSRRRRHLSLIAFADQFRFR